MHYRIELKITKEQAAEHFKRLIYFSAPTNAEKKQFHQKAADRDEKIMTSCQKKIVIAANHKIRGIF